MLLNLRGSHGSGKTYVSHRLIAEYDGQPHVEPKEVQGKNFDIPNAHVLPGDLIIPGRYKSGMDGIFPQTIVEEIIEYWAPHKFVLWENVMISANVGRWCVLSKKLDPVNHNVWLYLDTPLQVCIDRMFERRREASERGFNHRQEDGEVKLDVLAGHWRRCRRSAVRAFRDGIDVRWLDHTRAYEQVHDLLAGEGWEPDGVGNTVEPLSFTHGEARGGVTPFLRWEPTLEEQEYVLKTSILPWEPEDTQTKVDFKSPPKKYRANPNEELGLRVQKWGAGYEDGDEFGTVVKSWEAVHNPRALPSFNRIVKETS